MEFTDNFKRKIMLSDERWGHITKTHPEMSDLVDVVKETLEYPELIKRSVYDENIILVYTYYGISIMESTCALLWHLIKNW